VSDKPKEKVNRRRFFASLGKGAALGAGALAASAGAAQAAEEPAEGEIYRESEHVKAYYETTRF
jgi:spermidine/putrescine-binding protein